ncbi:hypothetical protein SEGD1_195 [Enterobacteria phage SEGD1]|uniref:Uncharacterized protein n=2 Tax=Seoulvirus SPN3US TaxID=1984796 RepID=G5DET3_9CAUD|nr:hypothetical protein ACQ60_gp076 [Salmonella phage SPN3US]AEP84023.1 hypothetical protein SPN3US_0190 [Salmonella phage SPN3US]AMR59842.1 hypothetical protein SEGD1_195 [Enterobacteria phage SEGD1]
MATEGYLSIATFSTSLLIKDTVPIENWSSPLAVCAAKLYR